MSYELQARSGYARRSVEQLWDTLLLEDEISTAFTVLPPQKWMASWEGYEGWTIEFLNLSFHVILYIAI